MNDHVVVIILNWRNAADTLAAVSSCREMDYPSYSVVVVDNDSGDGSEEAIRSAYPDITVMQSGANLGYAGGNNLGLRHALSMGADYVLIINNDVILEPTALTELVRSVKSCPDYAIATPMIVHMNAQDTIWACGARIDLRNGDVERAHAGAKVSSLGTREPFVIDVASGAAMLVSAEALEQHGLMDAEFFLYYEEADWCCRVVRNGGRIVAVPSSIVYHRVSATLGTDSPLIDYYMLRNQIRFVTRNWSGVTLARMLVRIVLRGLGQILAFSLKSQHGERTPHRDARVLALRDALRGRWGRMGDDVAAVCARHAMISGAMHDGDTLMDMPE